MHFLPLNLNPDISAKYLNPVIFRGVWKRTTARGHSGRPNKTDSSSCLAPHLAAGHQYHRQTPRDSYMGSKNRSVRVKGIDGNYKQGGGKGASLLCSAKSVAYKSRHTAKPKEQRNVFVKHF